MDKTFTSTNAQLRKLRSRGMVISNGSKAKRIIEMENYYNLINGYKRLFLDPSYSGPDEAYLPGTKYMRFIYSTESFVISLCDISWKSRTTSRAF